MNLGRVFPCDTRKGNPEHLVARCKTLGGDVNTIQLLLKLELNVFTAPPQVSYLAR